MADVQSFCRAATEPARDFNKRLADYCASHPVTNFELHVADGMPMVVLMMEEVQATELDVAKANQLYAEECEEAKEANEEPPEAPDLAVGDWIPASDPLIVQVGRVNCFTMDEAKKSEERLDNIYKKADGTVLRHMVATGRTTTWVPDQNAALHIEKVRLHNQKADAANKLAEPEMRFVQQDVSATYCAIGYLNPDELLEDDEDDDEDGGEDGPTPDAPADRRRSRAPAGATR